MRSRAALRHRSASAALLASWPASSPAGFLGCGPSEAGGHHQLARHHGGPDEPHQQDRPLGEEVRDGRAVSEVGDEIDRRQARHEGEGEQRERQQRSLGCEAGGAQVEQALEAHEEAAEAFVWASGAVLGVMLLGLATTKRRAGLPLGGVGALGTLVVLGLGYQTGQAGGDLVYRHGAGSAYAAQGAQAPPLHANPGKDDDDD